LRSVLERKVEEKEHFNANIIRGSPDIGNIFINYPGPGTAGKEGISNTNLFFYTNLVENSACISQPQDFERILITFQIILYSEKFMREGLRLSRI
jgi:hypothetical protein